MADRMPKCRTECSQCSKCRVERRFQRAQLLKHESPLLHPIMPKRVVASDIIVVWRSVPSFIARIAASSMLDRVLPAFFTSNAKSVADGMTAAASVQPGALCEEPGGNRGNNAAQLIASCKRKGAPVSKYCVIYEAVGEACGPCGCHDRSPSVCLSLDAGPESGSYPSSSAKRQRITPATDVRGSSTDFQRQQDQQNAPAFQVRCNGRSIALPQLLMHVLCCQLAVSVHYCTL